MVSQNSISMLDEVQDILSLILLSVKRKSTDKLSEKQLTQQVQKWFVKILFVAFAEDKELIDIQKQKSEFRLRNIAHRQHRAADFLNAV